MLIYKYIYIVRRLWLDRRQTRVRARRSKNIKTCISLIGMEKIIWTDHLRNNEVLNRVKKERNVLHTVRQEG